MRKLAAILCLILGLSLSVKAQTAVQLMPIPHPQFFGQNGQPLSGCKIFTYVTGTSTPQGTFFDSAGTIPNQNPVTCDAGGFVSIWLIVGDTYRILVQDRNGVPQYTIDGVVGIGGGGSLSLFSTPNIWTALQTFSSGASITGGNLTGTFTGSPAFSGTLQFSTFTVSNSTVIANLNASLWNGTSVSPAGGALTTGFVPVISGGAAATWGNINSIAGTLNLSQLPGGGVTTVGPTTCTIGAGCGLFFPATVYSTASASTAASIAATTMTTVGGSNASYWFTYYTELSGLGASCTGNTNVTVNIIYTDPQNVSSTTFNQQQIAITIPAAFNGTIGPAPNWITGTSVPVTMIRAKSGTLIQYSATYAIGTGCSPGPSYTVFPLLQQVTAN